jgi:CheY-like chemotaxis protein
MRGRPELAKVRILMLSSAGRSDQKALRSRLDISRILLKPTKHSDLLLAINTALGVVTTPSRAARPGERPGDIPVRQVLLVEDNPVNQKVAMDLLIRRGHSIELAQNGKEAVALVVQKEFDLVLMDVHMPVMDGLTATRAIREQERATGAHVLIIAMTAGATVEDRDSCFAAGMDDFVTKPLRARELYRIVEATGPGQGERDVDVEGDVEVEANPAPGVEAESCLEWQGALRKLDGDEELLLELVGMFLDQYPALMAEIGEAISAGEEAQLRRVAHTLKGSAQVIGGHLVAAAALQLEQLGRDGQLEAAGAALRELELRAAELEQALLNVVQHQASATGSQ